jgi:predicted transcriptional regulator
MVAIKVTNLKPNLVIFHGTDNIDEIALKIAEVEKIPVALIKNIDINKTMKVLRENFI